MEQRHRRGIRSFVCRTGRMTDGQQQAYAANWPRYGVAAEGGVLEFSSLFAQQAPVILEIGFGMGHSLAAMALANPQLNYLGVEVHRPGVGSLLAEVAQHNLTNIRLFHGDAVPFLLHRIPEHSLAGVQIFFPDPWHKTRHHKRRLIQPEFVSLLHRKLQTGGFVHLATDWQEYAIHMMRVLSADAGFSNRAGPGSYLAEAPWRPATKFERRGQALGHGVWDLYFTAQQLPKIDVK